MIMAMQMRRWQNSSRDTAQITGNRCLLAGHLEDGLRVLNLPTQEGPFCGELHFIDL
jgi:hypothetical protein